MIRTVFSTLIAIAALSQAHAAEVKIVTVSSNPKATYEQIVAAAEDVCSAAREHDPFDDFGTQEECVENTLRDARHRHDAGDAAPTRISSAR